ncbi:hypothetical protein NDU88_000843 [Pleurodeles waltl]|uniref:Uncharacterized protein n=1 Tax=Pleurodeles waltl TaxID=8319 RepID=A0AAV7THF7_PLEWA|nr:hypothetical protein NDU88_000843 [Pleurodeles waltl]
MAVALPMKTGAGPPKEAESEKHRRASRNDEDGRWTKSWGPDAAEVVVGTIVFPQTAPLATAVRICLQEWADTQ